MFEGETINKKELIDIISAAGEALNIKSVTAYVADEKITIERDAISGMQTALACVVRMLDGTDPTNNLADIILKLHAMVTYDMKRSAE